MSQKPYKEPMNIIDNMAPSCEYKYDYSKKRQDQDVLPQTKALLIEIYIKYLAESEEEREAWQIYKETFLDKTKESGKEKYDSQKVFKKHIVKGNPIIEDYEEIEVPVRAKKKSFLEKIFNKKDSHN